MCESCGCGNKDGVRIHDPHSTHADDGEHVHEHEHKHDHNHGHGHKHTHDHHHSHDHSHTKVIDLNLDILAGNNMIAAMNRRFFEGRRVLCLNVVSPPGSGKTTILEKTINHFAAS